MRKAFLLRDFALRIALVCALSFFLLKLFALLFVRLGFAK